MVLMSLCYMIVEIFNIYDIFCRPTLFCASLKTTETHSGLSLAPQVKGPLNGPMTSRAHLLTVHD